MAVRGEVLVAILNNRLDFNPAYEQHWYRIPVSSAEKLLKHRWPPQWLAFYQTKVFGQDAHAINYFSQVIDIQKVYRRQLFPNQPHSEKSTRQYYKLVLQPLQRLPKPISGRFEHYYKLRKGGELIFEAKVRETLDVARATAIQRKEAETGK
jgi:hypothetical protein